MVKSGVMYCDTEFIMGWYELNSGRPLIGVYSQTPKNIYLALKAGEVCTPLAKPFITTQLC